MVDSSATTGVPEDTADLTSGLMCTRELNCRFLNKFLTVRCVRRNIVGGCRKLQFRKVRNVLIDADQSEAEMTLVTSYVATRHPVLIKPTT